MTSWSSRAPLVIADLYRLTDTALSSNDCIVLLGPAVEASSHLQAVTIAHVQDNVPAVEHDFSAASFAVAPSLDRFTIYNLLEVLDGEDDVAAAMTGVYALLAGFLQVLVSNPFMGGAMSCQPGIGALRFEQSQNGVVASLLVSVTCHSETANL